jgi:hypothetical protein
MTKLAFLISSLLLAVICGVCPWIGVLAMHVWSLLLIWAASLVVCLGVGWEYRKWAALGVPVALFPFWFFTYGCAILGGPCL